MFLGSICIRVRGAHLSEMPCRSTCAIDDPTQIPEIKAHRPGRQDRADCLQRQAWDVRSPGKLSPGACQAPNESHLCPLIGVLSRELFAPILPAAYLNSQIAQITTSGALGRCCRRDLRRRCASENIAFSPTVGNNQQRWRPRPRRRSRTSKRTSRSMATPLADRKLLDNPPPPLRPQGLRQLLMLGDRLGATAISLGLPTLLYVFAFACNDISGCPAPSLLRPKSLDLETLKQEVGWPDEGIWGLGSWEATGWTLAYYLFNAVLYAVLPATEAEGVELSSGGRLKYRLNSERNQQPRKHGRTRTEANPSRSFRH